MDYVFIASEAHPYIDTGSLGKFVYFFIKGISKRMNSTILILPFYKKIKNMSAEFNIKEAGFDIVVNMMGIEIKASIYKADCENYVVYFIDNDEYFYREYLYSVGNKEYVDNAERFIFFNQAALNLLIKLECKPDLIHTIDWQTGLIPVYLKTIYKNFFPNTTSIHTIYNPIYQGVFSQFDMPLTNLPWDLFTPDKLEFYGKLNFLKGGIIFSDAIVVPSEKFVDEVIMPDFGFGLHDVYKIYKYKLKGISIGYDNEEWNPDRDISIKATFSAESVENRVECKKHLLRKFDLIEDNRPLIGIINRLTKDEGIDFIIENSDELLKRNVNLIFIGEGDVEYENKILDIKSKFNRNFVFLNRFNQQEIKDFFAGIDILVKPSLVEPGGLSQLYAMRYGALPLASNIGGLKDSIINIFDNFEHGNGFHFNPGNKEDFFFKLDKVIGYYYNNIDDWKRWQKNAILNKHTFDKTIEEYCKLFEILTGKKGCKK